MSLENASDEEKLADDNDTETVKDTSHEYVAKLRLPRRRLEDEDVTSKLSISLAESMLVSSTMVVLSDSLSLVVGALDIDVSDRLVLIETVSAVVGDELGSGVGNPPVGTNDGGSDSVGLGDGAMDGKAVGSSDGRRVGAAEGSSDGAAVGCALG